MSDPATSAQLTHWRARIERALAARLDALTDTTAPLLAAMRHALLTGGKRLRPLLTYASAHASGCDDVQWLDAPAIAVELIHAYSLVHDDLPAMDNDSLRRGQPTVHVAFGQAHAILAGDALQSLAFATLTDAALPASTQVKLLAELAHAAGASGMCGGQAQDIAATGHAAGMNLTELEHLHAMKTGALLRAAVRMGAISAGALPELHARLDTYANALGLAFQIRDDLLDIEGTSATLGKTSGKDQDQGKATFPSLIGVDGSRQRLAELASAMSAALEGLAPEQRAPLDALAHLAVTRNH